MSDDPADAIPAHLRRFLPERALEPTPAEKFDAWLAERASKDERGVDHRQARSRRASGERAWIGIALPLGILLAMIVGLLWRALA